VLPLQSIHDRDLSRHSGMENECCVNTGKRQGPQSSTCLIKPSCTALGIPRHWADCLCGSLANDLVQDGPRQRATRGRSIGERTNSPFFVGVDKHALLTYSGNSPVRLIITLSLIVWSMLAKGRVLATTYTRMCTCAHLHMRVASIRANTLPSLLQLKLRFCMPALCKMLCKLFVQHTSVPLLISTQALHKSLQTLKTIKGISGVAVDVYW